MVLNIISLIVTIINLTIMADIYQLLLPLRVPLEQPHHHHHQQLQLSPSSVFSAFIPHSLVIIISIAIHLLRLLYVTLWPSHPSIQSDSIQSRHSIRLSCAVDGVLGGPETHQATQSDGLPTGHWR